MADQRKIYRMNSVSGIYQNKELIPYIRLGGKWLSKLGFQHEQQVLVEAEPGRVVIREMKDERRKIKLYIDIKKLPHSILSAAAPFYNLNANFSSQQFHKSP